MAETDQAAAVAELLPFTRWTIVDLEPSSLERVAAYLAALMEREPLKSGPGWANERIVLGCLVTDLRSMVMAAGEPVGALRDLRDARTKADERSARQRADQAFRAYDDLVTGSIEADRAAHDHRNTAQHAAQQPEEHPRDQPEASRLTPASAPVPVTPPAEPLPDAESVPWI
jgi:hypothetical protein